MSFTLTKEHKPRVFENMELMKLFGPTRNEVTRDWRKLHNEELHDLYLSPNMIRTVKLKKI